MAKTLSTSDENHLRRLVAWVDCAAGQDPDAMVETVRGICERLGDVSDEGKARLVEAHAQACNTPQYIRAAIKALRKLLAQKDAAPYLSAMNIAGAALMPAEPAQTWLISCDGTAERVT